MFIFRYVFDCVSDFFDDFLGSLDASVDEEANATAANTKYEKDDDGDNRAKAGISSIIEVSFGFSNLNRSLIAGTLRASISRAPSGTAACSRAITIARVLASVASFTFIPGVALALAVRSSANNGNGNFCLLLGFCLLSRVLASKCVEASLSIELETFLAFS